MGVGVMDNCMYRAAPGKVRLWSVMERSEATGDEWAEVETGFRTSGEANAAILQRWKTRCLSSGRAWGLDAVLERLQAELDDCVLAGAGR